MVRATYDDPYAQPYPEYPDYLAEASAPRLPTGPTIPSRRQAPGRTVSPPGVAPIYGAPSQGLAPSVYDDPLPPSAPPPTAPSPPPSAPVPPTSPPAPTAGSGIRQTERWNEDVFSTLFGRPYTLADLIALEGRITGLGGKVNRNASGNYNGKVTTPDGRIIDIILAAGLGGQGFQWLEGGGSDSGGGGASATARPINPIGSFDPNSPLLAPWTTPFTPPTPASRQPSAPAFTFPQFTPPGGGASARAGTPSQPNGPSTTRKPVAQDFWKPEPIIEWAPGWNEGAAASRQTPATGGVGAVPSDTLGWQVAATPAPTPATGGGGGGQAPAFTPPSRPAPRFAAPTGPVPQFTPPSRPLPEFTAPGAFVAPSGDEVLTDSGYQFRRKAAEEAFLNTAAAQGTLRSGGTLKDFLKYGQEMASQEYGNVYNRRAGEYDRTFQNALATYGTDASEYDRQWRDAQTAYNADASQYDRTWQSAQSAYNADRSGYDQDFENALTGYGATRSGFDQDFSNALDAYRTNRDTAQLSYAPELIDWQTRTNQSQEDEDDAYDRRWREYLEQIQIYRDNQRNIWDRLYATTNTGLSAV